MNTTTVNLDQLKAMTGDDVSIMKEFIKMYLKDTPSLMEKILLAKTQECYIGEESVAWCCHKMAPQLSYMGMAAGFEMVKGIEGKLKELNGASYPELDAQLAAIKQLCELSYIELNQFIESN
jgi:HPt (histidine-containing phosphotransfer) domain-containing protein